MAGNYECIICGNVYKRSLGLPDDGIKKGTPAKEVKCIECGGQEWQKITPKPATKKKKYKTKKIHKKKQRLTIVS